MTLNLNIFSIIELITLCSAFMFGLLFLTNKGENRVANIFLFLFIWSLGGEILELLMEKIHPHIQMPFSTSLFTMVFLFFYVCKTINRPIKPWMYCLALVGVAGNLMAIDYAFLCKIEYLFNISILIYTLHILKQHRKAIEDFYTDTDKKTLQWIKIIASVFIGFNLFWILEDFTVLIFLQANNYFPFISEILTLFVVFWIGYNGFSQPEIFKKVIAVNDPDQDNKNLVNNIPLPENVDVIQWEKLNEFIHRERLFVNPKLNLRTLSESVELNQKLVSRLINQYADCNFYQYINQFRVDEFKKQLISNKAHKLSLWGVAQESGFNSKSTFHAVFKAIEGGYPKTIREDYERVRIEAFGLI